MNEREVWLRVYCIALAEALKTTDDAGLAASSASMHAQCAVEAYEHHFDVGGDAT